MSQDYENKFWQEVRQRKSKKHKKHRQKFLFAALGLIIAGIIYSLHQGFYLAFVLLYLMGTILITTLISLRYQHLSKKQIVGVAILLLVLGFQAKPFSVDSLFTQLTIPDNYSKPIEVGFTKVEDNKFSFLDLVSLGKKEKQEDLSLQWCPLDTVEEDVQASCQFPRSGIYEAFMFVDKKSVGQLKFKVAS
ncbi:MAG: hypothetical protein WBG70_22445 [Spirulinaceae cyanobacterium]